MTEHKASLTATLILPKGGKKKWSQFMYDDLPVSEQVAPGSPIVMVSAEFEDGTRVYGGVLKCITPEDCHEKFIWVFNKDGAQYDSWTIDTRYEEDFYCPGYCFSLPDKEGNEYHLNIVEIGAENLSNK